MSIIYRSKVPFRISFGGGGTDLPSYSDRYGGSVVNTTIGLFTHTSLQLRDDDTITFKWVNKDEYEVHSFDTNLDCTNGLKLFKATHNHIFKRFKLNPIGYDLITYQDVPTGCGLGTSSSLVVSIIGVYNETFQLELNKHQIAEMAFEIENGDLNQNCGRQDQYSTTFGGWNHFKFEKNNTQVYKLQINEHIINELENNIVLYFTNFTRKSCDVLKSQVTNIDNNNEQSINSLHSLLIQSNLVKDILESGTIDNMGQILDYAFKQKNMLSDGINTLEIQKLYDTALNAGSTGGKISGAGGGGFVFFYCPNDTKYKVIKKLDELNIGYHQPFTFENNGLKTWKNG